MRPAIVIHPIACVWQRTVLRLIDVDFRYRLSSRCCCEPSGYTVWGRTSRQVPITNNQFRRWCLQARTALIKGIEAPFCHRYTQRLRPAQTANLSEAIWHATISNKTLRTNVRTKCTIDKPNAIQPSLSLFPSFPLVIFLSLYTLYSLYTHIHARAYTHMRARILIYIKYLLDLLKHIYFVFSLCFPIVPRASRYFAECIFDQ